jgi:hypothetical protein
VADVNVQTYACNVHCAKLCGVTAAELRGFRTSAACVIAGSSSYGFALSPNMSSNVLVERESVQDNLNTPVESTDIP